MAKVAKLVKIAMTARVIVDSAVSDEVVAMCARPQFEQKLIGEFYDNLESVELDTECPYFEGAAIVGYQLYDKDRRLCSMHKMEVMTHDKALQLMTAMASLRYHIRLVPVTQKPEYDLILLSDDEIDRRIDNIVGLISAAFVL